MVLRALGLFRKPTSAPLSSHPLRLLPPSHGSPTVQPLPAEPLPAAGPAGRRGHWGRGSGWAASARRLHGALCPAPVPGGSSRLSGTGCPAASPLELSCRPQRPQFPPPLLLLLLRLRCGWSCTDSRVPSLPLPSPAGRVGARVPICRPCCQGTTWAGSVPCGLRMQRELTPGVQPGPDGPEHGQGSCTRCGGLRGAGGADVGALRYPLPLAPSLWLRCCQHPLWVVGCPVTPAVPPAGQQVIEEQRRRLAELKQRAAAEAQCQWDALHGAPPFLAGPSGFPPLMHSILHHLPAGRERGEEGEHAYDTLSLESSDSLETSASTGGASACSPDNVSRYPPAPPGECRLCVPHGTRHPARCLLSPLPSSV